ncbi:MAG: M3 family metallopeptidase [Elusimicrobiota bacterium]|jgi:thimet oligopeptidase
MNSLLRTLLAVILLCPSAAWCQVVVAPVPVGAGIASVAGAAAAANPAIALPQTSREMLQNFKLAETAYKTAVDAVVAVPAAQRTFANTVRAFENADARFSDAVGPGSILSEVSPDKNIRRMARAIDTRVSRLMIENSKREDIYRAYKEYAAKGEVLTGEDKKLVDQILRNYKTSGMELPLADREEIKAMQKRMNDLAQAFEKNLADYDDGLDLTLEELAGMPEDYVEGLPRTTDGKYRVGLDYPSYIPFMQYAQNGELRRQLAFKFENRAADTNVSILEESLTLRQALARKLGYEDYAHMAIEDRMAKTPKTVFDFLDRLKNLLRGPAAKESAALLEAKRKDDPAATSVPPWDRAYYGQKLQKALYDFDPEEVRQYFPVDRVVAGTLDVYQELLGLKFREVQAANWHEDVRLFEIDDAADGHKIGYFFLDLFPRKGKFGHAMAATILNGHELPDGGYNMPVAAMVANLSKPTPTQPALLTHDDVETFFHEFGHLMHQTLTKARYTAFSGTSVARDFVEAPSQLMENWAWRPEIIERLSGHYQDPSRKLPQELFAKMLAAKNFNSALRTLRQVAFAALDMAYHTLPSPMDTTAVIEQVYAEVGVPAPIPGTHFQANFGHLFGYAAGYYSYLWSLVYARDMFSRFEKEGVLNPATGMDYRRKILERGSSVEEAQSLREFLGREPSEEAFLRGLGLLPEPVASVERPSKSLAEFKNELLERRGFFDNP